MSGLEVASDVGDYVLACERTREMVQRVHWRLRGRVPFWVVFGPGTSDQLGMFVARLWVSRPSATSTGTVLRAGSLAELHDLLPHDLTRIGRDPNDDANIIETWV